MHADAKAIGGEVLPNVSYILLQVRRPPPLPPTVEAINNNFGFILCGRQMTVCSGREARLLVKNRAMDAEHGFGVTSNTCSLPVLGAQCVRPNAAAAHTHLR